MNSDQTQTLRSGAVIREVTKEEAAKRKYLSRQTLFAMHLQPTGEPCAYSTAEDGSVVYYFDPNRVEPADPAVWCSEGVKPKKGTLELPSGNMIERMSVKKAAEFGYFTAQRLNRMEYDIVEEPVAYTVRTDGETLYFYDKKTAVRRPLKCVRCKTAIRYKRKLCEACYEKEMAKERAEGDKYRAAAYHYDPAEVLYFDTELTGFYDHDELLSITVVNGLGELVIDSYIRPVRNKSWKKTVPIHGITPDMVKDAPTLEEITPRLKEIFAPAKNIIAYGVSTDYAHLRKIYTEGTEREEFHAKIRDAASEYVRYIREHRPDLSHASLTDAMATFGLEWEGTPHTSIADTFGCRKVWETIFPHYYD